MQGGFLKKVYLDKGHLSRAVDIIISSWRESTLESYNTYIQFWVAFNNDQIVLDSRATISRWIKTVMEMSGTDITVYKPHSTRSASVSKAASLGISTEVIF